MTLKRMTLISMASAIMIVLSLIKIPIPPVSFTLQTLVVILFSLLLNPVDSLLTILVYLLVGLLGLPIFTVGGGPQAFLGPTGGFLFSFIVTSLSISLFKSNNYNKKIDIVIIFIFGFIVTYLIGLTWYSIYNNVSFLSSILIFIPYYIWDIVKIIIAYAIYLYFPKEIIEKYL